MASLKVVPKMQAVGVSGALTVAAVTIINIYFPGVGDTLSVPIAVLLTSVINFVSGYMAPDTRE